MSHSHTRPRGGGHHLQLLLIFTLITLVGFTVPRVLWGTHVGYSLIALLLTQVMVQRYEEPFNWRLLWAHLLVAAPAAWSPFCTGFAATYLPGRHRTGQFVCCPETHCAWD